MYYGGTTGMIQLTLAPKGTATAFESYHVTSIKSLWRCDFCDGTNPTYRKEVIVTTCTHCGASRPLE